MDLSIHQSGAAAAPPAAPASPSVGYPTPGNPGTGLAASVPGAYWRYQLQAEIAALLSAAAITPNHSTLTQLRDAAIAVSGRPGHTYTASDWAWLDKSLGIMIQWALVAVNRGSYATFSFPTAWTGGVFAIVATKGALVDAAGEYSACVAPNIANPLTQFTVTCTGPAGVNEQGIYVIAIGR